MFVCEYCKKEFSTKGILTSHQKSTKYCLILQGKSITEDFKCQYCIKKFTTQSNLNDHLLICKEKPIKEYEEKLYNESKMRDEQTLKINQLNTELTETKKIT